MATHNLYKCWKCKLRFRVPKKYTLATLGINQNQYKCPNCGNVCNPKQSV